MILSHDDKELIGDNFAHDVHNTQLVHHSLASYEEGLLSNVKMQIKGRKTRDAILFYVPSTFASKTPTIEQKRKVLNTIIDTFKDTAKLYRIVRNVGQYKNDSRCSYVYDVVSKKDILCMVQYHHFECWFGLSFSDCKTEVFKSTNGYVSQNMMEQLTK